MIFQINMLIIGFLFSNVLVIEAQVIDNGTSSIMEETGQSVEIQEQPLTTPVPDQVSIKFAVDKLHLNMYEAAAGDLSLCGDDAICLKVAKRIKTWVCAAAACENPDTGRRPVDCFAEVVAGYSQEVQDQINSAFCSVVKIPSTETRQNLMTYITDSPEDDIVEFGAYFLALKGSSVACENYIKNYIGPYDVPRWDLRWYGALSGCRILARESTRKQEEEDFYRWNSVVRELGDLCLDIVNIELRKACSTPRDETFSTR